IVDEVVEDVLAENGISKPPNLVIRTQVLLQIQDDHFEFFQQGLQVSFDQITDGRVESVIARREE
ncbi:MAG: hypothetical protein Q9204_009063, partial [Flavoplaca sp. TL-2023a]